MSPLTNREKEVSELSQQGLTLQQIAERLGIKLGTVKVHRKNARIKIDQRASAAAADVAPAGEAATSAAGETADGE